MCEENRLNLCVKMDNETIYTFHATIDEAMIVQTAKEIEEVLLYHGASVYKIKEIFSVLVEVMQNILFYSSNTKELPNNKKEARGSLSLSYDSTNDTYKLESCNLIQSKEKKKIKHYIEEINALSKEELRQLYKTKLRSRENKHKQGAGLGLIVIAKRSSMPIEVKFEKNAHNLYCYKQTLYI